MGDLTVALRLHGTFIDFQPSSTVIDRRWSRSCPPCLEHGPEDTVELPDGRFYFTRRTRESCDSDLQISEDKDYLWALIERTQRLPQIRSQRKEGLSGSRHDSATGSTQDSEDLYDGDVSAISYESNGLESWGGWTCACGVCSMSGALFCWSCGNSQSQAKHAVGGKASAKAVGYAKASEEILFPCNDNFDNIKVPPTSVTSQYWCPSSQSTTTVSGSTVDSLPPLGEMIGEGSLSASPDGGAESTDDGNAQEITTLMICALPFQVTSEELLEATDALGFDGAYDFVYMPSRSTKKCGKGSAFGGKLRPGNVGYAFVNFRKPEDAAKFAEVFQGYIFPGVESDKQILVRAASCQGYDANCSLHLFNTKHQTSVMTFPARISE